MEEKVRVYLELSHGVRKELTKVNWERMLREKGFEVEVLNEDSPFQDETVKKKGFVLTILAIGASSLLLAEAIDKIVDTFIPARKVNITKVPIIDTETNEVIKDKDGNIQYNIVKELIDKDKHKKFKFNIGKLICFEEEVNEFGISKEEKKDKENKDTQPER